jgi:cell wall-associated NlpC family hydrolase
LADTPAAVAAYWSHVAAQPPLGPAAATPSAGAATYRAMARAIATEFGLDPGIFERQIGAESGFDPRAVSRAGAQGLGQLMPATARALGVTDPFDPTQNLIASATFMRQNLKTFGNDYTKALAAYNAGPGAVQKYGGVPPFKETQAYVAKILNGGGDGASAAATPDPRAQILGRASSLLGTPYKWGGDSASGIDCSAFVSRAWGLPRHTTDNLAEVAAPVSREQLQPGDALNLPTTSDPQGFGHVRLFAGWANPEHTAANVYEATDSHGGVVQRTIQYDDRYQPMRRKDLTGAAGATGYEGRDRYYENAPPAQGAADTAGSTYNYSSQVTINQPRWIPDLDADPTGNTGHVSTDPKEWFKFDQAKEARQRDDAQAQSQLSTSLLADPRHTDPTLPLLDPASSLGPSPFDAELDVWRAPSFLTPTKLSRGV